MDKSGKDIKVQLTLKQKLSYYWWTVYFWTPAILTLIGGIYSLLFIPAHGQIEYLFIFSLVCFIIGLTGYFVLRQNFKFETLLNNFSQSDNVMLIDKAVKELKWKIIKSESDRFVVAKNGLDKVPGQLITIIPRNNKVYFNCIHTSSKFTNSSLKVEAYREFREKIDGVTEQKLSIASV